MSAKERLTASGVDVFAVEHDALQIMWSRLPTAHATFEIAGNSIDVDATPPVWYRRAGGMRIRRGTGGPGALTVSGLQPSTTYDVLMRGPGVSERRVATGTTLPPPPGALISRFATISDCHFGERHLGALKRLHDPVPLPTGLAPYPVRCAAAAISESERWGASLIVAKGDLTQDGKPAEVVTAVEVLGRAAVPVAVTLGNHDVRGPIPPTDITAMLADRGFTAADRTLHLDIPGARLVLSHTPVDDRHAGRMEDADIDAVIAAAGGSDLPVLLIVHHPLRRWRVETHYPPSLRWRDSRRLAKGLLGSTSRTVVLAGHTHRNRRYLASGVPVVEVGSTKDYPGQWAGYSIFEGGIRQVVRRVESPDAIAWTEMTGRAIGGIWRLWSPGRLEDRCWSMEWSPE